MLSSVTKKGKGRKKNSAPNRQFGAKLKGDAITKAVGSRDFRWRNMPPEIEHMIASFMTVTFPKSYAQAYRELHAVASWLLIRKLKIQKPVIEMTNILETLTPQKISVDLRERVRSVINVFLRGSIG